MNPWVLGVAAFVITVAETFIASRQTQAIASKRRLAAANWAVLFEAVLLLDILMLVERPEVVAGPILLGAWIGMYWSFNRR